MNVAKKPSPKSGKKLSQTRELYYNKNKFYSDASRNLKATNHAIKAEAVKYVDNHPELTPREKMFIKGFVSQGGSRVEGSKLRSVWFFTAQGKFIGHSASYPEAMAEMMIDSGCPNGGTVLDPFMGSGTTAVAAKNLGCNYIGFEMNPEYITASERRLNPAQASIQN